MLKNYIRYVCCMIVSSVCSACICGTFGVWNAVGPFFLCRRCVSLVQAGSERTERLNQLNPAPSCPPAAPGDLRQRRRLAGCVESRERELPAWGESRHTSPLWAVARRAACTSPSPACALLPPLAARDQLGGESNRASRALRLMTKGFYVKTELIWVQWRTQVSARVSFFPATTDTPNQACALSLTYFVLKTKNFTNSFPKLTTQEQ